MSQLLLKQHKEKRASAWAEASSIIEKAAEESRAMSPEERTTYDAANEVVTALTKEIDTLNRHAEQKAALESVSSEDRAGLPPTSGTEPSHADSRSRAFSSYLRTGKVAPGDEQYMVEAPSDLRTQSVGGGNPGGGYLVPETMGNKIIETITTYSDLLPFVTVERTSRGEEMSDLTEQDPVEAVIVSEQPTVGDHAGPDIVWGRIKIGAYWYSTREIDITYQLLQDAEIDVESRIMNAFGERMGRGQGRHLQIGTGVGQPQGLITGSAAGVTAPSGAAPTWKDLIRLEHSLDQFYRRDAMYGFSDKAVEELKLAVDGQQRPIWQPGITAAEPDRINRYRYTVLTAMDNTFTVGKKTAVFGDFKRAYKARIVNGLTIMRLNEIKALNFTVVFVGFARMDGKVMNASASKVLTHV
jgi:HK97 family phage major capsid protein